MRGRNSAARERRVASGAGPGLNSLSGANVGIELPLDPGELILEEELAPLHAGEGQLIVIGGVGNPVDCGIQVPVLGVKRR